MSSLRLYILLLSTSRTSNISCHSNPNPNSYFQANKRTRPFRYKEQDNIKENTKRLFNRSKEGEGRNTSQPQETCTTKRKRRKKKS
ncbi:hypothetical protein BC829DRAFT_300621 [Chytridium lagenaria]|nr:hypothetical protein BC829DRAFT_300621 [Chytridium lagenaria]